MDNDRLILIFKIHVIMLSKEMGQCSEITKRKNLKRVFFGDEIFKNFSRERFVIDGLRLMFDIKI